MKMLGGFVAGALLAILIVTPASAQHPGASPDPHHPDQRASSPGGPPAPGPGMKDGGLPMMDMCRQMMGDTAGMPMMGGGAAASPEEKAHMLQMRGEMMKAMGDIMLKHAQRMEGTTGK